MSSIKFLDLDENPNTIIGLTVNGETYSLTKTEIIRLLANNSKLRSNTAHETRAGLIKPSEIKKPLTSLTIQAKSLSALFKYQGVMEEGMLAQLLVMLGGIKQSDIPRRHNTRLAWYLTYLTDHISEDAKVEILQFLGGVGRPLVPWSKSEEDLKQWVLKELENTWVPSSALLTQDKDVKAKKNKT